MPPKKRQTKLFVLDTNVLLHDPSALFHFEEHDILLPFAVLEELDKHKSGVQDINRNARQTIRLIGEIISEGSLEKGHPLKQGSGGTASGRLFFQSHPVALRLDYDRKADNEILSVVSHLVETNPGRVVALVSKDINLRIKAGASGLLAEDYLNDQVVEDVDLLYPGVTRLDWNPLEVDGISTRSVPGRVLYFNADDPKWMSEHRPNEFIVLPDGTALQVADQDGRRVLRTLAHYGERNSIWGIKPLNIEQSMALNLLMDPDIDLVSLLGPAGTGKTLLTLAAALQLTFEHAQFREIIYTRATVPMGDDIGFLPGGEEEKMHPWLGALEDSLDVLLGQNNSEEDWKNKTTRDLVMKKVRIKSIAFMRGRTFHEKLVILDEAQNLTPKQIKALITRAGPGSKLILLGNVTQIDVPYLTEGGSGLTYAVERFKQWPHFGHIILTRGERSRLATYANDNL